MSKDSSYGWGLFLTIFGGAGLAENVTSGRGSFIICCVTFSIGFGLILWSYMR